MVWFFKINNKVYKLKNNISIMNSSDSFWAVVEVIILYGFFYYLLDAIKNSSDLYLSALILTFITTIAVLACPWVRNTDAWRRMVRKKK